MKKKIQEHVRKAAQRLAVTALFILGVMFAPEQALNLLGLGAILCLAIACVVGSRRSLTTSSR